MRIFFIIGSIVFLSLHSDGLLKHQPAECSAISFSKILNANAVTKNALPIIKENYRSSTSIKNVKNNSQKVIIKKNVFLHTLVKTRYTKKHSTLKNATLMYTLAENTKNKMLHKFIKESGEFKAFASVRFNYNSYEAVDSKNFQAIMRCADQLIFDRSLKISIAGFTDNKGNDDYNEQLSMLRASHIKSYLVDLGVNADQIILSANGSSDPVAGNATAKERAENRRVELAVIQ